jgi:hypothetical protein
VIPKKKTYQDTLTNLSSSNRNLAFSYSTTPVCPFVGCNEAFKAFFLSRRVCWLQEIEPVLSEGFELAEMILRLFELLLVCIRYILIYLFWTSRTVRIDRFKIHGGSSPPYYLPRDKR